VSLQPFIPPAAPLVPPAGDIGGTGTNPLVISTSLTSPLPVPQGGLGLSAAGSPGQVIGVSAGAPAWLMGLGVVAATPLAGTALVNGTPTILSWTAPNDGVMHRVHVIGQQRVTVLEVGGAVALTATIPDGSAQAVPLAAAALAAGYFSYSPADMLVAPGATVRVVQQTALTIGAAVMWAEIWGS
jgi:hypothetical protein